MERLLLHLLLLAQHRRRRRDERGDVPGLGAGHGHDRRPGDGHLGRRRGPAPVDAHQRPQQRQVASCAGQPGPSAVRRSSTSCWSWWSSSRSSSASCRSRWCCSSATRWPRPPPRARGSRRPPTAARPTALALTRDQIDGVVSGRFAQDVRVRQVMVDGAPGIEVVVRAERAGAGHRRAGRRHRGRRPRGRGGAVTARRRRDEQRQRPGRAHLARHPAPGPAAVDPAQRLRGAARRLRGEHRRAVGRPRLRAGAERRRRPGAGRGGGPAGAGRPGPRGRPADRAGHLHAVPRRLPQRYVGDHRPRRTPASTSRCCPTVLGGEAPSFALDASHTVPIGQYQEVAP